jgi:hypothetical protein
MSGDMPQSQAANNAVIAGSPIGHHKFLIPSPIPTHNNNKNKNKNNNNNNNNKKRSKNNKSPKLCLGDLITRFS